jgi:ABC-type antimicrobial peptide transport system permease subunit
MRPLQLRRFIQLLPRFTRISLALGTLGIYGTMSMVVRQRRREMGIRIALGASPMGVVHLVTKRAMLWTVVGLALGFTGALGAIRWLQRDFYGIEIYDPPTFIAVTLILGATAYAACFVPAARASRVDPLRVIREGE